MRNKLQNYTQKLYCYFAINLFLMSYPLFEVNNIMAAEIQTVLPGNIIANADYRQGNLALPAVLVVHGFMTTHHFNLVQIITNELAERHYSVLAPTLSLKINDRREGLDCEAIHTHDMAGDVAEIEWWVKWLIDKGHNNIILVGHSTGSMQLAAYALNNKHEEIRKIIFTAPAYYSGHAIDDPHLQHSIQLAGELIKKGDNDLGKYYLSYCKDNYTSTPEAFLSYTQWSNIKLINTFRSINIPFVIILGEMDHRFGVDWAAILKSNNLPVIIIPGADHFFDSPYELDFLDTLLIQVNNH